MEVHIKNFRCIKERRVVFNKGVNLLKGDRGTGKSTIFEAVRWCLYGGMKNIVPFEDEKAKISVTVSISNDVSVNRCNRPEKIVFSKNKNIYEGDEAKEKILEEFGTRELWETSSYLRQKDRNFLLQACQKDRTEIIKELIFAQEEGNEWKERFNLYKEELRVQNSIKSGEISILEEGLSETNEKDIIKAKKRKDDLEHLSLLLQKRDKIKQKIDEYEKFLSVRKDLEDSKKIIDTYEFPLSLDFMRSWKKYHHLYDKVALLEEQGIEKTKKSQDELIEIKRILKKNREIIEHFFPTLDETLVESIDASIESLYQEKMSKIKDIEKIKHVEKLRKEKQNVMNQLRKDREKLVDMEEEKEEIEKNPLFEQISEDGIYNSPSEKYITLKSIYRQILNGDRKICPKCKTSLLLDGEGELNLFENIESKEKIKNNLTIIDMIDKFFKEYVILRKSIDKLKNRIENDFNDLFETNEEDFNLLEKQCKILASYNPIGDNRKMNIDACLRYLDMKNLNKELNKLYSEYEHVNEPLPDNPDDYYYIWEKEKQKYDNAFSFIKKYNIMKEEDYINKREKLEAIDEEIGKLEKVKTLLEEEDKLKRIRGIRLEIGKNDQRIVKAGILAEKIDTHINQNLSLFLTDFNNLINEATGYLFEDMIINLSLFKNIKDGKRRKPNVNVEICYRGNKYESFFSLSGGEQDSLSLPFTLVFSRICRAKFIFLDECISSLNEELRNKSVSLIKNFCDKDCIVVNVCHETIEGYYDNVISYPAT